MLCGFLSGDYVNSINEDVFIRIANENDAYSLSQIYKPFVENTAISFEYLPPDAEEFRRRIIEKIKNYPFIVAEYRGEVVGYAYASEFLPRPAYKHSVETTVYLKDNAQGKGIGKKLYLALEKLLKLQSVLSLNACIACTDAPDEILNNNSMMFHSSMGYRYVGRFNASGYKFNRFYDMIWMEKLIAEPDTPFAEFKPFCSVLDEAEKVLSDVNACL